ncbi:Fibrocystin-L [Merluccius polli]|uniref:Fibrocystin-L n=1 Tax=Merluccius polli TaxID=89951 RepID=A0AA47NPF1_MERPO|nr:Fibrocystin-L [Merluccius polli]
MAAWRENPHLQLALILALCLSCSFAQERQFQLNPANNEFGNRVVLVSSLLSVPCDVERDSTHGKQVMCYTRAMPNGHYRVRLSIDGVPIPDENICSRCSFYTRWYRTPTITSLSPSSGPPGTVVTARGQIFTNVYGSNTAVSSNGLNVRFLRYRLELDHERSWWGHVSCRITGTYVEVTSVSPSRGSVLGGTLITVQGRFFDQTDRPAVVLVGGKPCPVQSVSDDSITCVTPPTADNMTFYPGGRGMILEMWNDTNPRYLEDVLMYNASKDGYWSKWVDATTHTADRSHVTYTSRFRGFFVPPASANYNLFVHCDDRCNLYLSNSTDPEHKVKIAYQPHYMGSFYSAPSQKSEALALEKGKAYYMEMIMQQWGGPSAMRVGMYTGDSLFTADQSDDAVNEQQNIVIDYNVTAEKQVLMFDSWPGSMSSVEEVQKVSVSSSCVGQLCDSTFFSLAYGDAKTGQIAVSASAEEMEAALNELWSLKPDSVQVQSEGDYFTVTFVSQRGRRDRTSPQMQHQYHTMILKAVVKLCRDFDDLQAVSLSPGTNVSVTEVTKGQGSLETFTLRWGGVHSQPIPFNASEDKVKSALDEMFMAGCPAEVQTTESSKVFYYRDFEDSQSQYNGDERGTLVDHKEPFCGAWSLKNPEILFMDNYPKESGGTYGTVPLQLYPWLCLAYRGVLRNEIGVRYSYRNSDGVTVTTTTKITSTFSQGDT